MLAAGVPIAAPQAISMLVDTGASHTALDVGVINALNLQPTGSIGVLTPSTQGVAQQSLTYDIDVLIVGHNNAPQLFQNIAISECHVAAQGIGGLIGRDIISQGLLTYSGPGSHFYLSF